MNIYRDGILLTSGDTYTPGELLTVSLSNSGGDTILEVTNGASFLSGS